MKTMLKIILFFFVCLTSINSQTNFPLHVGDRWRFWEYPNYYNNSETVSDTSTFNGKKYFDIHQTIGYGEYFRQSGDSVFVYDGFLKDEYLLYDFSASVGDTITNFEYSQDDTLRIALLDKGNDNIFGLTRQSFIFYIDHSQYIDDEISLMVTDSFGVTRINSTWYDEHLTGAVINSTFYGDITGVISNNALITKFILKQNYPNPFNPSTVIEYSIPADNTEYITPLGQDVPSVQLKIFNMLGQEVSELINKKQTAGNYKVKFNAGNLPSGIYFYRLKIGNDFIQTMKMALIR